MKKISFSLLFTFIFSLSFSAYGFGGKGYVSGNFWAADLDRNEQLNRDEAKAVYNLAQDDIFNRYDKNNNERINFTEFSEFMQQSPWSDKN